MIGRFAAQAFFTGSPVRPWARLMAIAEVLEAAHTCTACRNPPVRLLTFGVRTVRKKGPNGSSWKCPHPQDSKSDDLEE